MIGVLGQIEVSGPSQLLLNDKSLFQKLEPSSQKFVLDLQEIPFAHVHLEGLVDDGESRVILHVLPSAIAMNHDA